MPEPAALSPERNGRLVRLAAQASVAVASFLSSQAWVYADTVS